MSANPAERIVSTQTFYLVPKGQRWIQYYFPADESFLRTKNFDHKSWKLANSYFHYWSPHFLQTLASTTAYWLIDTHIWYISHIYIFIIYVHVHVHITFSKRVQIACVQSFFFYQLKRNRSKIESGIWSSPLFLFNGCPPVWVICNFAECVWFQWNHHELPRVRFRWPILSGVL